MKHKILLLLVVTVFITSLNAQKKEKPLTGYAITAAEKGGKNWKEVRLVDITTGQEVKTIYQSTSEVQALNARTGNPVVKKEADSYRVSGTTTTLAITSPTRKVINLDQELDKAQGNRQFTRVVMVSPKIQTDKPFATNSAALAYDKKNDRLYYTPMSINQLRYIDLKSNKIYYFEDEEFGKVSGFGDVTNQITRMVIASDGNGYALTNDANHLIRFTTGKNPVISDLGPATDDAANAKYSVHSPGGYGGDMIADASANLYLITANRNVFKISIENLVAKYLGVIKGLPQGFSTNGAMVEAGSKVIIASSESTVGYYRFDLTTMQAEKVSASPDVFNASDLANGNLAFDKKKKDKKEDAKAEPLPAVEETATKQVPQDLAIRNNGIAVYPNPVTDGVVKLSFADQPAGRYQVQLLDLSGKLIGSKEVAISGGIQIEEFRFPELSVKGNYFLKIFSETNKVSMVNKIVVQ